MNKAKWMNATQFIGIPPSRLWRRLADPNNGKDNGPCVSNVAVIHNNNEQRIATAPAILHIKQPEACNSSLRIPPPLFTRWHPRLLRQLHPTVTRVTPDRRPHLVRGWAPSHIKVNLLITGLTPGQCTNLMKPLFTGVAPERRMKHEEPKYSHNI